MGEFAIEVLPDLRTLAIGDMVGVEPRHSQGRLVLDIDFHTISSLQGQPQL